MSRSAPRPTRTPLARRAVAGLLALVAGAAAASADAEAPSEAEGTPYETQQPIRGVIELFTSQGCSSCPPADALLGTYAGSPGVIALSFPVDYWDYLGWKDTLANPRNTDRQRSYAKARGDGAIYTPQVVVNGVAHVNGASRAEIDLALEKGWPKLRTANVPVRFWMRGQSVVIQAGAAPERATHQEATIWLAVVKKTAEVAIRKGENAGRSIVYTNVVRELAPVGMWTGKPIEIRLARNAILRPQSEACAVLLQAGEGGPIIGAAWLGF